MVEEPFKVFAGVLVEGFHVDALPEAFHGIAVFGQAVAEDHRKDARRGVAFRIPDERRDADAAREEQRRGSAFHGEAIAEGPPEVHLVAAPEFGHFFGASAGHLEKDDELVGAHPADGERTGPGHIERPALRTEHDELSRRPTLPIGPFEAQGKKTSLRSGEPEGNIINNRQVVKRGLTHVRTSCLIQVLWSFVVCMPPYGQGAREVFCNSLEFRRDGCSGFV